MVNAEISFRDVGGIVTTAGLHDIPAAAAADLAKLTTLVTSLKTHTNAGIAAYSLNTWTETIRTSAITPVGVNSLKANILVRYVVGAALTSSLLWLPNPNPGGLEMVTGEGLRMTQATLDLLTAALSTLAGFTVTAIEGKISTRNYSGDLSPAGNCIRFGDQSKKLGYMGIPAALCASAAALDTFAGQLETDLISQSAITGSFFLAKQETVPSPTTGIGLPAADATNIIFSTVETGARLKMSYANGTARKYETFKLPAIHSADCDVAGGLYKVDPTVGAAIATALSTFYGASRTLTFRTSKIIGVNFDPQ